MAEKKTMVWNGEADNKMLLAILGTHDIKVDHEAIAVQLGCSTRAVQERLKKLRKQAQISTDESAPIASKHTATAQDKDTPAKKKSTGAKEKSTKSKAAAATKKPRAKKSKGNPEPFEIYDEEAAAAEAAAKQTSDDSEEETKPKSKKRKYAEVQEDEMERDAIGDEVVDQMSDLTEA